MEAKVKITHLKGHAWGEGKDGDVDGAVVSRVCAGV